MVSPCTGLPVHFLLSIILEFEKVITRGGHPLKHSMAAEANQATDWGFWARSGGSLSMEMVGSGCRL